LPKSLETATVTKSPRRTLIFAHVGHASLQELQKIVIREVRSRSQLALTARFFGEPWSAGVSRPDLNRPQARRPEGGAALANALCGRRRHKFIRCERCYM